MPRAPRADEAGGLYHVLNRGNSRARIFHKDADYEAFERILAAGRGRYDVQLFSYQLMPNHWHLVLRPNRDGEMSRFLRWITATHTMRYHAHYHTSGEGHVYQGRFKSFPIQDDSHFLTVCSIRRTECLACRAGGPSGTVAVGLVVALVATDRTGTGSAVLLAHPAFAELGVKGQ